MSEGRRRPERSRQPANRPCTYTVSGQLMAAKPLAAGLYLVATPIGNLGDITLRALETLAAADMITCEDTRVTHRLLERYGISSTLSPYHEHNAQAARPKILERLAQGAAIALVSDAGTPLVSDPGYKLVRAALEAGRMVTALPGASAPLAALTVSCSPDSCRRSRPRGARALPNSPASLRPWCCSSPGRGSGQRSPISPPAS